jgi:predicted transcriptional regulator
MRVGFKMRPSKLEVCIDILQILSQRGSSKLSLVTYEANLDSNVVKGNLDFLTKCGLVKERIVGKRLVVYEVNLNGANVIKYFRGSTKAFPIVEDSQKGSSKSSY